MTVSSVSPTIRYPYTGPGSYSFSFLVYDEDDITITHTDTEGLQSVLTIETDYTVSINSGSPGGSITMIYAETTGTIEIARVLDFVQETAWENEGALDMELLEKDFDRTVMLLQQLKAIVEGSETTDVWRGAWVTATDYYAKNSVISGSKYYRCVQDHTSGTLATDVTAGYWVLVADFSEITDLSDYATVEYVDDEIADVVAAMPTPKAVQVFTSSGTYTKTSGATIAVVEVVGGGGGGGGAGAADFPSSGGGAGGYSKKRIDLSSVTTETVTVGAGGTAGSSGNGGNGGTSSFGSHCSATGGAGGTTSAAVYTFGGDGGAGSGGDINISGAKGGTGKVPAGEGAGSFFGGGGTTSTNAMGTGGNGLAPGAGGGGCYTGRITGGAGAAGIVIVTEY